MRTNPYLILFISIVSVSFAAILIVSAKAPPLTLAFYRLFFTFVFIAPYVFFTKRYRKEFINLLWPQVLFMLVIGIFLAAHFSFWITSLTKTSVASSVILVTSHPIFVAPLSHFFLKEKLSLLNILGIILSIFGASVIIVGNYGLSSSSFYGDMLAIIGGVAAGVYIMGGRKMRKTVSTPVYAIIVYGVACLTIFFLCLIFSSSLVNVSYQDYVLLIVLALISGVFGHTLYNWSLKFIPASVASVSLLGEPLGSTILAFVLPWINQTPTFSTLIGGIFFLLGVYFTSRNIKFTFFRKYGITKSI